jgi:hypothetical protein
MEMWRRRGEAASAAALYFCIQRRLSEAVVSYMASAVALAEVGRYREAVQLYVTLRAEVDGDAGEYNIAFYRGRRGIRYLRFYVRGGEAVARAVKLIEV